MKFNCKKKTKLEYEIEMHRKFEEKVDYLRNWHKVFAWFPVRVEKNECRWLERVERRYPAARYAYGGGFFILRKSVDEEDVEYRALR